jgi:hypothetical protein
MGNAMRTVLLLLAIAVFATAGHAATVAVVKGNIVVDGKRITSGGLDSEPVLTPAGKRVIFNRGGPIVAEMKWCADEDNGAHRLELWSIAIDGTDARRLLSGHGTRDPRFTICGFQNKQFSSDGRLLYFETPAWATSGAAHVLDLKTGKERFFLPSNGLNVLSHCSDAHYRDDLIVAQHRYFVFEGSYDWLWLFAPDGKEIGPIGEDDATLKDACG